MFPPPPQETEAVNDPEPNAAAPVQLLETTVQSRMGSHDRVFFQVIPPRGAILIPAA